MFIYLSFINEFIDYFPAPTAPTKLTVYKSESPTTIYLEWQPLSPDKANGKVLGYLVAYLKVSEIQDFASKLVKFNYTRISPRNFTFTGLQPFTEYFVGVAPFNSKGYKVSSDWSTHAQRVKTLEGGKLKGDMN